MMRLIIGADIVPTKSNQILFCKDSIEELVGSELLNYIRNADYRCFNLEAPLINNGEKIKKNGSAISGLVDSVNGIKSLGTDLLFLSNNHIMDYGVKGLISTIEALKKASISFVGADIDNSWYSGIFIVEKCGFKIGFYNCCEHEFSVSSNNGAGANPFIPEMSYAQVKKLSQEVDFVIVIYHGGKEYYRFPSPELQRVCHYFVENGASLVITQHSHCIGSYERYSDGQIVYGQGNFLFDGSNDECWQTSLLLDISINEKKKLSICFIPIMKRNERIMLADSHDCEKIMSSFNKRNEQIKQVGFIEEEYKLFSLSQIKSYILSFKGYSSSIPFRIINKITCGAFFDYLVKKTKKNEMLRMLNYIECEAHRELIITGLKELLKDEN